MDMNIFELFNLLYREAPEAPSTQYIEPPMDSAILAVQLTLSISNSQGTNLLFLTQPLSNVADFL